MSDQTPRAIPVADDAAPESLAEASFETATATHKRSDHHEPHAGPGLWARAREAFFALPRGLHIVILIIFMILGFAWQHRYVPSIPTLLRDSPSRTLSPSWTRLGTQEQNLQGRRAELAGELDDLQSAASEADAREQASAKAALQAQIAAGTVAVQGPGVTISVADPGASLSPTQFVMTLGELRNAGAEAIDLNGVRLTMRSAFTGQAGGIIVDGTPIAAPYTWTIIGDSQTIATALEIQAGSASQMRAKGAVVTITPTDSVTIHSPRHAASGSVRNL